ELAASLFADEFAIADLNFAADGSGFDPADDGEVFEGGIIDVHLLRLGGDCALMVGIENHQVGIRAGLDRSLPGEQAEQFGGFRRSSVNKAVEIDSSSCDTVRIEKLNPICDARKAVGNFHEVAATHFFLFVKIKRTMIGGDRVD